MVGVISQTLNHLIVTALIFKAKPSQSPEARVDTQCVIKVEKITTFFLWVHPSCSFLSHFVYLHLLKLLECACAPDCFKCLMNPVIRKLHCQLIMLWCVDSDLFNFAPDCTNFITEIWLFHLANRQQGVFVLIFSDFHKSAVLAKRWQVWYKLPTLSSCWRDQFGWDHCNCFISWAWYFLI